MDANAGSRQFQMTLLRQELIKIHMENDSMQKSYQETIRTLNEEKKQLTQRLNEQTQTINEIQAELKDTQRQLMVHENYNNPSSQATLFAKKRKKYRRTVKALDEGATLQEAQNSKGKRGRRIGAKGTPPTYTPDPSKTKEFVADICGGCGRTDTTIHDTVWKIVVDIGECGAIICYMEKITSAYCDVCRAVTQPATDSIPGTWAGPNLRRIIMNIHGISPTVDGISKLLKSNHNCDMSSSAVSNCLSAMAAHARNGTLRTYLPVSEDDSTPYGDTQHGDTPMVSGSKPPVITPHTDVTSHDNTQYTIWEGPKQSLLRQMEGEASITPWVMEDESRYNVGGKSCQTLVLLTPTLVFILIRPGRSKVTIEEAFHTVLNRPLIADMYCGGQAFSGEYQTCCIHVWRKSESLAIKFGVESPEHTYCTMLLNAYRAATDAAAYVTELAGGPSKSACDIGRAIRTIPELAELVEKYQNILNQNLSKLVHTYRYGDVSSEDSQKFADTLENAAPYMGTFIGHPGMAGNTNAVEGIIRRYIVKPRNIQRILPDWSGARTMEMLQTIHATCDIRGIFSGDVVAGQCGCWSLGPTQSHGKPPGIPPPTSE